MSDKNISIEYNEYRIAALEKSLKAQNKNIAEELLTELDSLYEKYVPNDVRYKIESLAVREEAEIRQSENCFAVYRLHDDFDDFHFTDECNNTFYDAACRYRDMSEYGYRSKTTDTIASEYFPNNQPINASVFSVLCDTMPNNRKISALIEFDLENEMVGVCDSSDNSWRVYSLEEILDAVRKVSLKSSSVFQTDREVFEEALQGKELMFDNNKKVNTMGMQM